ncbi:hypothetical protein E3N88_32681 [Mikania micrantha]|uniref:Uncharacterized protein n=1 Tax=Mikania micrantha TaxID=192012 RepID=A0A5N6MAE4_9ASTR|nr:hypothetical protein E3N88_32681 [Mikania micrantha]
MVFGKHQVNTQGETETYISNTQDYVDLDEEVQQSVPTPAAAAAATSGTGASGSQVNRKNEEKATKPLIDEVTFQGADKQQLCRSFPQFHLEDKVNFKGEGNVVKESPDSDKSVEPQPNSKKVTSPVATKEEPKLRRSKRVQQPNRKWEDFVCTTTSA